MKKLLIILHRWLGFPLGLLFVVTFGTGCLTAIDELLQRMEQSRVNASYRYQQTTTADDAAAISVMTSAHKGLSRIVMPTQRTPYYRASTREENWTYIIDDLNQVIHEKREGDGFFRTVLQLHRNFLLGKEGLWGLGGKYYVVWVGLIALLLSLLGLWLWWPLRRGFNAKDVVPRGKRRKHFYFSHMTNGIITLAAILLLSLTGASITYRSIAQQVFGVEKNRASAVQALVLKNDWQTWLSTAYAQMPEGSRLSQIRYPRQPRKSTEKKDTKNLVARSDNKGSNTQERNQKTPQLLDFRFSTPGDWFGLARSSVKINKRTSILVNTSRFEDLPLSEKIYSILVPLHTGHNLPVLYVLILFVFSFLGTLMVASGLISFAIKKRKWKRFKKFKSALRSRQLSGNRSLG